MQFSDNREDDLMHNMFNPGAGYRRKDVEDQCRCFPNQIWRVQDCAVLVVFRSANGSDWPLGKRGLMRVMEAYNKRKVQESMVVLVERNQDGYPPVYVNHESAIVVWETLSNLEPMEPREEFGPCWFVDADFDPVKMQVKYPKDNYDM